MSKSDANARPAGDGSIAGHFRSGRLRDLATRLIVPLAGAALTVFALLFVSPGPGRWFLLLVGLVLLALSVYDWFQSRWVITRNYPVAGRIRWGFYKLRPYLRQYIVEGDLEGKPFSSDARDLVYARARGETDTHPFGTERDLKEHDYHWLGHSIVPAEDPEEAPCVTVGHAQTGRPYDAALLNVSAMSFGSISAAAVEALTKGAAMGGFYVDTGEGGISPYHLEHGGDLVWEIGSGYFGCRDEKGRFDPERFAEAASHDAVKMVEIKLSQGAKPGHGGMLPAAKVTEEIAATRHVPAWKDCISPRAHSAFRTPVELLEFAAQLREKSGGKPVGLKLCVGMPHEVLALMKAILETGILPEFIVVDGGEGGTGAAPVELSDWVGMPLDEGLGIVRNALLGTRLHNDIRLAASGKVYSGMGLAHNFASGADWCNAARAFMFSIGCIQAQRCHLDTCPTGITTQNPWRQRGLVVDVQAERAARFQKKTVQALTDIAAAIGLSHPNQLEPHHLSERCDSNDANTQKQAHQFLEEGVLLDDPDSTSYAAWWRAAQADTFAARQAPKEEGAPR